MTNIEAISDFLPTDWKHVLLSFSKEVDDLANRLDAYPAETQTRSLYKDGMELWVDHAWMGLVYYANKRWTATDRASSSLYKPTV